MKKIYTYLAMFVAAATMVACENAPEGNVTPDATGKPINITIGDLSRVMLGEDGKTITWEVGDVLGLFHVINGEVSPTGNNSTYTVKSVSDDGKTATITGDATWSGTESDEHEFYIYYSRRNNADATPTVLKKTLTAEQKYNTDLSVWENFGNYIFAYGKATSYTYGEDVVFDAIDPYFGMLRLNITNNTGKEITISKVSLTNDTEVLVGTHSIDLTTPNAPIVYAGNEKKTIALTVTNGSVAAGESIDVRFLMSAKDYSATNFTVAVTSEDGLHPEVTFTGGNIGYGARAAKAIAIEAVPTAKYKIGDIVDGGVLFWISSDAKTGKIIAGPRANASDAMFCVDRTTTTNATDDDNGANNMATVKAVDATYANHPAFKFCSDMGEGWYLPARTEVKSIIAAYCGFGSYSEVPTTADDTTLAARQAFDAKLTSLPNGVALDGVEKTGESVYTSTEKDATNAFYFVINRRSTSDPSGVKNSSARTARCIKVVELTE